MSNELSLRIGSVRVAGWKSVEVTRSIKTMASTFSVDMTDIWQVDPISLLPESNAEIFIGNDKILSGYIDNPKIRVRADSYDLSITGRCKTADLVDCSAINKPGTWKNVDLLRLATDLVKPFGLNAIKETSLGEKVLEVSINTGESVFDMLQKVCKERAVLPIGSTNGDLLLTVAGNTDSTDNLVYGGDDGNILQAEGDFDYSNRFSIYQVKGQTKSDGGGWGKTTTNIFGQATDESVGRYRPKLFSADGLLSNVNAKKRASWEAQVRAGRSTTIRVVVPGWRQSDGSLWRENMNVYTYIPALRISAEMLIEEITYSLSNGGRVASMVLVPAVTYLPNPSDRIKKRNTSKSFGWN